MLLNAYCQGIFPMHHSEDDAIYWYDPDPRAIIPLEHFHVPKRLRRTIKQGKFEIRLDTAFTQVMEKCAEPTDKRKGTWINEELIELYTTLHTKGFAHSLETYLEGKLVGGIYGISVGGFFAGESMFSHICDSSKVALVTLLRLLKECGFVLFDVQFITPHLKQFGAIEVPRDVYQQHLADALNTHPFPLSLNRAFNSASR